MSMLATSCDGRRARSVAKKVLLGTAAVVLLSFAFWPVSGGSPDDADMVAVHFSATGETLLAGTKAGEIFLLNVDDGSVQGYWQRRRSWFDRRPAPFNSIALGPRGDFAVYAGQTLTTISFERAKPAPEINVPPLAFGGVAVSRDGKRISAVSSAERLLVWNLEEGSAAGDFGQADAGVYGASVFSPDGKRIASAGHTVRMLDAQTGAEVWSRPRDSYASLCIAFSPDGKVLATGGQDASIRIWKAETGDELAILRGHPSYVDGLAFSPDGKEMASWGRDGQLFLWDLATSAGTRVDLGITEGGAEFSPDGRWIASGEARKTVGWWDAKTGKKVRELSIATETVK